MRLKPSYGVCRRFQLLTTPHNTTPIQCSKISKGVSEEVRYPPLCYLFINSHPFIVNDHEDEPRSGGNLGQPNFWDSSTPLFSMYSKIAEEEDNKMAERWNRDADVILIFVSPRVSIHSLHP
jgi:hypothetical protein